MLCRTHHKLGLVALTLMASFPAQAYLDPGTGSVILQAIIATVVAGLATMRLWWDKLLNLFSSRKDPSADDNDSSQPTSKHDHKEP